MTSAAEAAERIRNIGLYDLQPTLPGLLAAIADFCQRHGIRSPRDVSWTEDRSRGFTARIELSPADFFHVAEGYPMPVRLNVAPDGALVLETDLRAGVLRTSLPLAALEGRITGSGLLLTPTQP